MNEGLVEYASGMTLGWALLSLAVGAMIIGVVIVRIRNDYKKRNENEGRE